jgi:hypothetical protein
MSACQVIEKPGAEVGDPNLALGEQFLANLAHGEQKVFVLGHIFARVIVVGQIWGASSNQLSFGDS